MAAIWLAQANLENATSLATVAACFDDANNPGTINQGALAEIIERAEQEALSWLVTELGPPPLSATVMAQLQADAFCKYASLDYAVAFMYERHPEYVRSQADEIQSRVKRADTRMERVLNARQRPPTVATRPANVGGVSVDGAPRIISDSPDGTYNGGDF